MLSKRSYGLNRKISLWSIDDTLIYIITFFLIISGPTVYHYLNPPVISTAATKWVLCITCLLYTLKSKKLLSRSICLSMIAGIYLLLFVVLSWKGYGPSSYFIKNICIPSVMYILFFSHLIRNGRIKKFVNAFVNIIICIAAVSVFCWIFGTVLRILPFRTSNLTYTWAFRIRPTSTYLGIYFETQTLDTALLNLTDLKRNCGIFCESPGYSHYLNIALAIELIAKKPNKKRVGILLLAIITSFSTKAYLVAIVGLFLRIFMFSTRKSRVRQIGLYMLLPFLLLISAYVGWILINDKLGTGSGYVRMAVLQGGITAWLHYPLFGVGFTENNDIIASITAVDSLSSMGLTTFLAKGGIYMMLYYIGSIVAVFHSGFLRDKRKELIIFIILMLIEFFISDIGTFQDTLMMVALGYTTLIGRTSEVIQMGGVPSKRIILDEKGGTDFL